MILLAKCSFIITGAIGKLVQNKPYTKHKKYRKISYKMRRIPKLKCISSWLAVFAQYFEAGCQVENEDVVGAAPTGDAPTTSEWSTI